MKNQTKHLLLALCFAFSSCLCVAMPDDIPTAVWRPGFTGQIRAARFTPDGSRLTITTTYDVKIIDVATMRCVYVEDYAFRPGTVGGVGDEARRSYVTETGEYLVTHDANGTVWWRRVSDTSVVSMTSSLPRSNSFARLISDTVLYIDDADSGVYVSINGSVTYGKRHVGVMINDSLSVRRSGPIVVVVHSVSDDTVAKLPGFYMGVDFRERLYVYTDSSFLRYDCPHGFAVDTVAKNSAPVTEGLIRGRFLLILDAMIDVIDGTRYARDYKPLDVLPDRRSVQFDYASSKLSLRSANGVFDTIQMFDGPVARLAQDPRDSAVFIHTNGTTADAINRPSGRIGMLTESALILGERQVMGEWQAPMFIRDSLTVAFTATDYITYYGYYNLDRVRAGQSALSVVLSDTMTPRPADYHKSTFAFSSRGDTLRYRNHVVYYAACPERTAFDSATIIGFIPGTLFYVVGRNMYKVDDCEWYLDLVNPVVAIAPSRDRVLLETPDSLILSEVVRSGKRHNAISKASARIGAWSDDGLTARIIRGLSTIVSMHSDGSTDSVSIPQSMQSIESMWQWSSDGTVATGIKRDTLVSIDVRTGQVLREYNAAPWLAYISPEVRAICLVGAVDGRLVVSLPGGAVATFPGLKVPVTSDVKDQSSPLRTTTLMGTRIVDAIPESVVTVYSLLGTLVMRTTADALGQLELHDKGLPHGAYIVTYHTINGLQSGRLLL